MKFTFVAILLFIFCAFTINAQTVIPSNHSAISVEGCNFISFSNNEMVLNRFNPEIYSNTKVENLFDSKKAQTTTGISLSFSTKSPLVKVKCKIVEGLKRGPVFSIYKNDVFVENRAFKYRENEVVSIKLINSEENKLTKYTIALPLKTNVTFLGLELDEGYDLEIVETERKHTYVAFGDSITHGTGQQATSQTYAYQLAQKSNYQLYNLAVGGGKTSVKIAEMIRDDFKSIDVITVLLGFNDYNGEGVTVETYKKRYNAVLNTIRETHKDTKIYCISLLTTKMNKSKTSGLPIKPFRDVVKEAVKLRQVKGDNAIFLIDGKSITTLEDLNDNVHLNVSGSKAFASELYKILN